LPDAGRGNGQVQTRVQDGKRETVAQGVVPGGPGVGADQVQVVFVGGDSLVERNRRRRDVPEGCQRGGDGPEQESQTRRVGHPTVQAQTGGVRRPARGYEGSRGRPRGQDPHPDRAPTVRKFGVGRVAGVVGRRRGGRLQVVRRPARRGRGARQTKQVPDGRRPEQQQDPAHTRGPADVVPVPRLRVFRRGRRCAVLASAGRRRQREVARLAAGRDGRRLAPVEEHRILLALDGRDLLVGGRIAASQPVAQLRFGTVGPAGPDAAQKTVEAFAATATRQQYRSRAGQKRRRRRLGDGQRKRRRQQRRRRRQTPQSRAQPSQSQSPTPQRRGRRRSVGHKQHNVVNAPPTTYIYIYNILIFKLFCVYKVFLLFFVFELIYFNDIILQTSFKRV